MANNLTLPTIGTNDKGDYVVTSHDGASKTFKAKDAMEAIKHFNAVQAEYAALLAATTAKSDLKFQITYRNELQVIDSSGFPVITATMDKIEWLKRNFSAIVATAEANSAKIAADYTKRPKSLGKDVPNDDPRKAKTPVTPVIPTA